MYDSLTPQLFDLLENKSFEELSTDEKSMVLTSMTEDEYRNFRVHMSALEVDSFVEALEPKNSILENIKKETTKNKKAGFVRKLWATKVPLPYAAALVVGLLLWNGLDSKQNIASNEVSQDEDYASWKQDTMLTSLFVEMP